MLLQPSILRALLLVQRQLCHEFAQLICSSLVQCSSTPVCVEEHVSKQGGRQAAWERGGASQNFERLAHQGQAMPRVLPPG